MQIKLNANLEMQKQKMALLNYHGIPVKQQEESIHVVFLLAYFCLGEES